MEKVEKKESVNTEAKINKAREILKSLSKEERTDFISNFDNPDLSDEQRQIAIDRLISKFESPSLEAPEERKRLSIEDITKPIEVLGGELSRVAESYNNEFQKGFFDKAADVTENVGFMLKKAGGGDFIEKEAEEIREYANSIPPSNLPPVIKGTINLIGQSGPAYLEFVPGSAIMKGAKVGKVLSNVLGDIPSIGTLTESAALAVQGAVNGFRESGGDPYATIEEAGNYFAMGLSLNMGISALSTMKEWSEAAAKKLVESVTGNAKLAKHFVRNLRKYGLGMWKKVGDPKETRQEGYIKLDAIKKEYEDILYKLNRQNDDEAFKLSSDLESSYTKIKGMNDDIKNEFLRGKEAPMKETEEKSMRALSESKTLIEAKMLSDTTHIVEKLKAKKNLLGNSVEQAISNIVLKDPGATVKSTYIVENLRKLLEEKGLYKIERGKVIPQVRSTYNKESLKELNNILQEIKSFIVNKDEITVSTLQGYKILLQQRVKKGPDSVTPIISRFSAFINPAHIPKSEFRGIGIEKEIHELGKANHAYSSFITKYKDGINLLTKKDASDNLIPDYAKVLTSLKRRNQATLGQIRRIDSTLDPKSRILTRFKETTEEIKRAEKLHKETISLAKKKIEAEKRKLFKRIRKQEHDIAKANKEKKYEKSIHLQNELRNFKLKKEAEIESFENSLKEEVEFLEFQREIRSFMAPGRVGNIQTAGILGLMSQALHPNMITGGISALSATATSPRIVGSLVRTGLDLTNLGITKAGATMLQKLLKVPGAKSAVSSSALSNDNT